MRKFLFLLTLLFVGTTSIIADSNNVSTAERHAYLNNSSPFIFIEDGITFSVFPDGEFDFYINHRIGNRRRNISFNSGYDYNAFVQYDDYGAIIQVENAPIYYDYYGRVVQIGLVEITYHNRRVHSIGNMTVFYNNRGYYDYHTGYINRYNRRYQHRSTRNFFARPANNFCLVYNRPYRRNYRPTRYTYYNPYRYNTRRTYAEIGREHRFNNNWKQRSSIYRNDRRVAINSNRRSSRNVTRSNSSRARQIVTENTNEPSYTRQTNNRTIYRSSAPNQTRSKRSRSNIGTTEDRSRTRSNNRTEYKTQKSSSSRSLTKIPNGNQRSVTRRNNTSRSSQAVPAKSAKNIKTVANYRSASRH